MPSALRLTETLFVLSASLFLGACVAEEPWTRDRQERVTNASLPVSPSVALKAAEKAVRELDPRSTTFDYRDGGFRASRQFSTFMIVAAMQGTYVYDVQVEAAAEGSVLTTRIYQSSSAITAAGVSPASSSMWQIADAYQLLQDRVRYHAGLMVNWVSCEEARSLYKTNGAIEPICLGAVARDPAS